MTEVVFSPPTAILFIAIGVVIVGVISVFLKQGEWTRKIVALVIVGVVAGGLLLVLYRSTTLTVDGEGLRTTGVSGVDLAWDEVDHAYFETSLVVSPYRPTVRTRGTAIGDFRTGRFLMSNGDPAQVLMEREDQAVVIVTEGLTYLFAPADTQLLADAVNQHRTITGVAE